MVSPYLLWNASWKLVVEMSKQFSAPTANFFFSIFICSKITNIDVDHQGVPNAVLVEEKAEVAQIYNNKSVAEQNSLEIGWALLMEPCYRELRDALFQDNEEVVHLRKLLVTATLATDIADKELASMRRDRAAVALAVLEDGFLPTTDDIASQKATFILETLIQVADVSHLMMPFAFYKRWNYKLLRENYEAFKEGRVETMERPE